MFGRYQHPPTAASTVSASTFASKNTPRQWGDDNQPPSRCNANTHPNSSFRSFECDDDNDSIASQSTFRTLDKTAISSSFGGSKIGRGRSQLKAPPRAPGYSKAPEREMGLDFNEDDDDLASLTSSMVSLGRGRGRGRGYRVPNQQ